MPDRQSHLERAGQNEHLGANLNRKPGFCADWAVTILFYSALHYVDAFLAGKHYHPPDHESRDDEIERNGSLAEIYRDYRRLKDWSREARYGIANYPPEKVDQAMKRLENIKLHIMQRL